MTAQTADWKTQAQEKRSALMESITDAIKALAEETDAVRAGETLARYFDTLSKFHQYSLHNLILISIQKPDATLVAGFLTWKHKFNRWVKKGEKGIAILAPRVYQPKDAPQDDLKETTAPEGPVILSTLVRGEEEENQKPRKRITFTTVYVFDISQTEGDPLPDELDWREKEKDPEVEKGLTAFAESRGIQVEIVDEMPSGAEGWARVGKIGLLPTSGTHTFVHELAHVLYEHCTPEVRKSTTRQQREIEADAAAHVVCKHFGISSLSPNYLALWEASKEDILSCLDRVRGIAVEIIEAVEGNKKEVSAV